MKRATFVLTALALCASLAQAQPIRSGQTWAIYPQPNAAAWEALTPGQNLAVGKPVTARPDPTYRGTGNQVASLTDGVLAGMGGPMWGDPKAVGWAYQDYVRIVIDLGEPQPVGRVVARFQAIPTTNFIPRAINLGLSMDGEYYYTTRALIEEIDPEDDPAHTFAPLPNDVPVVYAVSLDAGYEARYVQLDLTAHGLVVSDEIAVLAAEGQAQMLPAAPPGEKEYLDNVFDRRDQFERALAPGNLMAGKPFRYAPQPKYAPTTNETDATDLTNGQFVERVDDRLWFEKNSVCWQGVPTVTMFADLGQPQAVGQVVARFLGGADQPGLTFPDEIRVLASNDGENYYLVASRHKAGLDDASAEAYHLPEAGVAWAQNFFLPVGVKARYLALQVSHQKQFICSDEIAVVRGRDSLPALVPTPDKLVQIVTSGICFSAIRATLPICANFPLRMKVGVTDARSGAAFDTPSKLVLDLPEEINFVAPALEPEAVSHDGKPYRRYTIPAKRYSAYGLYQPTEFFLQAPGPNTQGTLYMYGDSGNGLENERAVAWEAVAIPPVRVPQRLQLSISWAAEDLFYLAPNYLDSLALVGFNGFPCFPRYWVAADLPKNQARLQAARDAGFKIIVNESPNACLTEDRNQPETKSQLAAGPSKNACPSYRGQYWQKQLASFGQHAVWCRPDFLFYDIEAFWSGAREAPLCSRCQERYKQGNFTNWDDFCAAMGREMLEEMRAAIDQALAEAGVQQDITYVSYHTEPINPLCDGVLRWSDLYPDLLQVAQPSLYVAGNQMKVAEEVAADRAQMPANDIIPALTAATYGEFEPSHSRDMLLETFANGGRGACYYAYGDFDPAHFMYIAEAVAAVAPVEDIFMDGAPLAGLTCDNPKAKVCGMGLGDDLAVLVSNYRDLAVGTKVKVTTPAKAGAPVWDLHTGEQAGTIGAGGILTVALDDVAAHMYYVGTTYAAAVSTRP